MNLKRWPNKNDWKRKLNETATVWDIKLIFAYPVGTISRIYRYFQIIVTEIRLITHYTGFRWRWRSSLLISNKISSDVDDNDCLGSALESAQLGCSTANLHFRVVFGTGNWQRLRFLHFKHFFLWSVLNEMATMEWKTTLNVFTVRCHKYLWQCCQ